MLLCYVSVPLDMDNILVEFQYIFIDSDGHTSFRDFSGGSVVKNPPANAGNTGDTGSIPEWKRSSGGGNSDPLQYPCLENPVDRGAWWAIVYGVAKTSDVTAQTLDTDYFLVEFQYIVIDSDEIYSIS